jgi:hypothetical protein
MKIADMVDLLLRVEIALQMPSTSSLLDPQDTDKGGIGVEEAKPERTTAAVRKLRR